MWGWKIADSRAVARGGRHTVILRAHSYSLGATMADTFRTIGLIGKPHHNGASQTLALLYDFLHQRGLQVVVEEQVAATLPQSDINRMDLMALGANADLVIVVGGDGFMLGAARVLARFGCAVIGVNRGNLGFLTDLDPEAFAEALEAVLAGHYQVEQRFLLEAQVIRHGEVKSSNTAMNEAVLHPNKIAHMIEFEVFIDEAFVYHQRSDGLIIATPTGSTAYSLSGGGPILHPSLNAIVLTPMFPHTLASRPLVVSGESCIRLRIAPNNDKGLEISCDGHVTLPVLPGDDVILTKHPQPLTLLHPNSYDYYEVLRRKLGWGNRLF